MGWPLSQDYNEAVQSPRASFSDPDLKGGEVVPGPMGLPLPRSGNFADVYQVRGADGRMWAVKCFTRPVAGLGERYAKIDEHLREARLPFAVGFRFLPEGIRVRGQWYPVLKMEWVEGFTLNEFVRQQANKPEQLKALLGMWVRLCKRLRDADIAHADLQHGNVLLVPGETANKLKLRLIDYDGMWVPALASKPSGEAGHPAYQHPARLQGRAYTAEVDRFPHLVIGCALRAVAVAGKSLWDQFDNGDNLLFREADLADPSKSKVFKTLWSMDDPTITNLVALIAVSGRRPLKATPWLDEVLSGEKAKPVSDAILDRAADLIGVEHRAARKALPVAQIYLVPEEANAFADLWSDTDAAARPRRPRRKVSKLPFVIAGGAVAAAVAVVIAILLTRDGKDPTPPGDGGSTQTTVSGEETPPPSRRGTFKTEWVALPVAAPMPGPKSLVDGIDRAGPGNFHRKYGNRGAAPLGVWFLPDGARAVVAQSTAIGVLDLKLGRLDPAIQDVAIVRATVTPDGRYAVIADRDRIIRGFDMRSGLELFAREFPADGPVLLITPDGKRVAMTADGVGYAEWSVADGKEVRRHELLQASLLDFSPDGTRAIAVTRDGAVEMWDLDEGKTSILSAAMKPTAICISADGQRAMAAGDAPEIRIWDVKSGRRLPGLPLPVKRAVTALAAAADGTVLVGTEDGEVAFVPENGPGAINLVAQPKDQIAGFSLTTDGKHALVATEQSAVYLTRTRPKIGGTAELPESAGFLDLARSTTAPPQTRYVAVSAERNSILIATQDRLVFHDLETLRQTDSYRLDEGEIIAVSFGPEEQVVVSTRLGDRYQTRALNVKSGEFSPPFTIPGRGFSQIIRLVPVPKSRFVIGQTTGLGDVLFDANTGKPAESWPTARAGDAVVAAPNRDGSLIAIGSTVRPIQVWEVETATLRRPFEASLGFHRLAFTPDGQNLIGLGQYGRIRIWDRVTGKVIRDVDHDNQGMLNELVPLGDDLVAVGPAPGWTVMNLTPGKLLGTGNGPDPLIGRVAVSAKFGGFVVVDPANRLATWKINREKVAKAPMRPARKGPWPDAKLVRDAPKAAVAGLAHLPGGQAFVSATADGRLTRYSADRFLFQQEENTEETPLRAAVVAGDRVFVLGRRSVVVRDAETFEKVAEFPVTIPTSSTSPVFAVRPDGGEFLVASDRVRVTDLKLKKETVVAPPRAAGTRPLTQFVYSADGKTGVARWGNSVTTVWLPRQTTEGKVLEDLKSAVLASSSGLALSADGKMVVLGTRSRELRAWNTVTGKVIQTEAVFGPDADQPVDVDITLLPDQKRFLTAAENGQVTVRALETFAKLKEYKLPAGSWRATISPDGRSVVLQCNGQMARLELPEPVKP